MYVCLSVCTLHIGVIYLCINPIQTIWEGITGKYKSDDVSKNQTAGRELMFSLRP